MQSALSTLPVPCLVTTYLLSLVVFLCVRIQNHPDDSPVLPETLNERNIPPKQNTVSTQNKILS